MRERIEETIIGREITRFQQQRMLDSLKNQAAALSYNSPEEALKAFATWLNSPEGSRATKLQELLNLAASMGFRSSAEALIYLQRILAEGNDPRRPLFAIDDPEAFRLWLDQGWLAATFEREEGARIQKQDLVLNVWGGLLLYINKDARPGVAVVSREFTEKRPIPQRAMPLGAKVSQSFAEHLKQQGYFVMSHYLEEEETFLAWVGERTNPEIITFGGTKDKIIITPSPEICLSERKYSWHTDILPDHDNFLQVFSFLNGVSTRLIRYLYTSENIPIQPDLQFIWRLPK